MHRCFPNPFPARGRKLSISETAESGVACWTFLTHSPQGDGNAVGKIVPGGPGGLGFPNPFPARGRKLPMILVSLYYFRGLHFPNPFPARGRKLASTWFCGHPIKFTFLTHSPQGDGNCSTEVTVLRIPVSSFLTHSPQGDGNISTKLLYNLLTERLS